MFGPGSLIAFPTGTIYGEQWIEIGSGTMIGERASICAGMSPGHDLGPGTVLRIGDRCVIGRGSHIVAHASIDIGDDVFTGPYVYITDQNHSYADPSVPIGRQWPVNAPVSIGAGTWLGTGVIVLPGAVIGRNVVVAAGSVVRGEIADRCVIAGVPARVVKRFDGESGWTKPLAEGSDERIASLVNEALAGDSPRRRGAGQRGTRRRGSAARGICHLTPAALTTSRHRSPDVAALVPRLADADSLPGRARAASRARRRSSAGRTPRRAARARRDQRPWRRSQA